LFTRPFTFFSLKRPALFNKKGFKFFLWALMMGSFAALMVWVIPKGDISRIGFTILVFMEAATALAVIFGILFTPRTWCTFCPMGTTTERIRGFQRKRKAEQE
jgi:polyferredoxin